MKQHFPVSQSNLSATALRGFVVENYDLPELTKASLMRLRKFDGELLSSQVLFVETSHQSLALPQVLLSDYLKL